jgi:hypothetical protein
MLSLHYLRTVYPSRSSQAALEKFEYLPIKCQVIRGRQTYLKYQEDLDQEDFWGHTLKSKVQPDICGGWWKLRNEGGYRRFQF